MIENTFTRRPWLLPLVLLLGALLFHSSLWPLKQKNGILNAKDLNEYTYPYFDFLRREVRENSELPLWNPHNLSGISIIGNGEVNLFYPPNWLIYPFTVRRVIAINVMAHGFIGMWGVAALSRRFGASYLGAMWAGLVWGGCGFIGARIGAGHYTLLLPLAWLPWLITAYHWAIEKGTWRAAIPGAFALGLMILSGHPQMTLIALPALLVIAGYYMLEGAFVAALRPLILIGILGLLIAAVAVLPLIGPTLGSDRNHNGNRLEFADQFSLPANQLITFVFPRLFGGTLPGDENFEELFAYSGLLPFIALAVMMARPTKEVWLLTFLGGLGILLSLGLDGGIIRLLIEVFPPFGWFRSAGRWLVLTQLALACLGGLWITWLQTTPDLAEVLRPWTTRILPGLALLCFLLAMILSMARLLPEEALAIKPEGIWKGAEIIGKTGLLLILLALALNAIIHGGKQLQTALLVLILLSVLDVWSVSLPLISTGGYRTYRDNWYRFETLLPHDDTSRILVEKRRFDTRTGATGRDYYDIYGYEQIRPADYMAWINTMDSFLATNRLLGVEFLVRSEPFTEESELDLLDTVAERPDDRLYIYAFKDPVPRAFLAGTVLIEPDKKAALDLVKQGIELDTVIVHKKVACAEGTTGEAHITSYHPNRVEIEVEAASAGLLFLSDRFDPDWRVEVNEQPSQIFEAHTTFRGVCVPAGKSTVIFSYRPNSLRLGGVISLLAILGSSIVWAVNPEKRFL